MPFAVVQDMPGISEREYLLFEKHLGPDRPPGLLAHVSGSTEEGWRIVNIWESKDAFMQFRAERLMPAVGLAAQEDPTLDLGKAAQFRVLTVTGNELPF
jgi:hypothetical protein